MERDKILKQIGGSVGIIFNREERELFDLKPNDKVKIIIEKIGDRK
jgi:hypothetical protein